MSAIEITFTNDQPIVETVTLPAFFRSGKTLLHVYMQGGYPTMDKLTIFETVGGTPEYTYAQAIGLSEIKNAKVLTKEEYFENLKTFAHSLIPE